MDLLDQIKADRKAARMNKNGSSVAKVKVRVLTTLVGEAETALKGKQAKKFDMMELVNTFVVNLRESLKLKYTSEQNQELLILEEYLPRQLTDGEIAGIITLSAETNLGKFMGFMQRHYKGQYKGKSTSDLFKLHMLGD